MTNSRPPSPTPMLPEFRDVHQDDDGWHAVHIPSGREISAGTWSDLEVRALVVRVSEDFKRTLG